MTNSAKALETAACAHCGHLLQSSKISKYSVCLKCKSCGGYSAVRIVDGSVKVKPIKRSEVKINAGIFLFAAAICAVPTIIFIFESIICIRSTPEYLVGFIPAIILMGGLSYFFTKKAILTIRGN